MTTIDFIVPLITKPFNVTWKLANPSELISALLEFYKESFVSEIEIPQHPITKISFEGINSMPVYIKDFITVRCPLKPFGDIVCDNSNNTNFKTTIDIDYNRKTIPIILDLENAIETETDNSAILTLAKSTTVDPTVRALLLIALASITDDGTNGTVFINSILLKLKLYW